MSYPYIPGAVRFVEGLREKGIPAAVVTSSNQAKMAQVYAAHPELKKLFTAILTSEDTPRSKPAPDCYLIAAERLQCPIRSCVVLRTASTVCVPHVIRAPLSSVCPPPIPWK